jgi:hypothetical protein
VSGVRSFFLTNFQFAGQFPQNGLGPVCVFQIFFSNACELGMSLSNSIGIKLAGMIIKARRQTAGSGEANLFFLFDELLYIKRNKRTLDNRATNIPL